MFIGKETEATTMVSLNRPKKVATPKAPVTETVKAEVATEALVASK